MSEMLFGIAQVSLARSGPGEDDASFPPVLADVCHARAAQFIRRKIPPIDPGHLGGGGSLTSPPVGSAFSRSLARIATDFAVPYSAFGPILRNVRRVGRAG